MAREQALQLGNLTVILIFICCLVENGRMTNLRVETYNIELGLFVDCHALDHSVTNTVCTASDM
jgi:hypothetical protein